MAKNSIIAKSHPNPSQNAILSKCDSISKDKDD